MVIPAVQSHNFQRSHSALAGVQESLGRFWSRPGCGTPHMPSCLLDRQACEVCRWVEEFHVDGFRFDLASALCRDPKGNPIAAPPLIHDLANDPVLSKVTPLCSLALTC